ncbi:NAD-dependent epimerase/dehydratase family protein [Brevundimonas sp. GCM10030266]|uniref:NAD-dependent epimerase/dehydratase family protein n=1 Tax=Brevundimonas sp. GCM10030266 TaxID=3273386 RepID=UPI00361D3FEC
MTTPHPDAAFAAATEHARPTRLFLTGAGGYVGRNLIRFFTRQDVELVALVRTPEAAAKALAMGAVPVIGDLLIDDLTEAMVGCDALIHAAADTDHGHGSAAQMRTNADGTRRTFAAARAAGVTRAVHLSTESVLADGRPLCGVTEETPFPRRPAGAYSRSKIAAERNALALNGGGLAVMVVRPRFVWGEDDTTALPQLVEAARSGQLAWIDGGGYRTSTTHIENLCHGIDLALRRGRGGEVYFLSDGEPVAFRTMISALLETQGVPAPEKTVPRAVVRAVAAVGDLAGTLTGGRKPVPLTLQGFAASAVEVTLDISRARTELGYAPVVSRQEGLRRMRASADQQR